MVDRRGAETLDPRLDDSPLLREVGDNPAVQQTPTLCIDLRRARMASGRELEEVASALRIRQIYLEALEEGRFDDLPGATYAAGFLRTYSEYLGINPDEMVERLRRETATGVDQRDLSFPVPPKEGRYPKPWLILMILLVAGLAYGGWNVYSTDGKVATEIVSDVSNTLTEAAGLSDDEAVMAEVATEFIGVEEEMATTGQEATQATSDSLVSEQSETADENAWMSETPDVEEVLGVAQETTVANVERKEPNAPDTRTEEAVGLTAERPTDDPPSERDSLWDNAGSNSSAEPTIVAAVATPEGTEAAHIIRNAHARALDEINTEQGTGTSDSVVQPARETNVYGEENADYRIAITATADSWVQIQGPNNELMLTRILRAGDVYQVPNRSDLLMVTGNAGALEVRVDGNLVGSLGPVGVVRRNVSLDPDTLVANTTADSQQ